MILGIFLFYLSCYWAHLTWTNSCLYQSSINNFASGGVSNCPRTMLDRSSSPFLVTNRIINRRQRLSQALDDEMKVHEVVLKSAVNVGEQLVEEKHFASSDIKERIAEIHSEWKGLEEAKRNRWNKLQNAKSLYQVGHGDLFERLLVVETNLVKFFQLINKDNVCDWRDFYPGFWWTCHRKNCR